MQRRDRVHRAVLAAGLLMGAIAVVSVMVRKPGEAVPVVPVPDPGGPGGPVVLVEKSRSWRSEVMQRVESSFRDVYLQLLSIVQGVAFGLLAEKVVPRIDHMPAVEILRAIVACLVIVGIWQEYMVGATMFAWIPTILDSVIPYALGAAEYGLIYTILKGTTAALSAVVVTGLVGIVAYGNYWYHAKHGFAANRLSYRVLRRHLRYGFSICSASALLGVMALIVRSTLSVGSRYDVGLTVAVAGPVLALALHSIWNWSGQLYSLRRQIAD